MALSTTEVLILLAHAAATFYLVGLVWMVQRVHYPLFAAVGSAEFAAYERAHVARITPIVAPVMLIEAATALALVVMPPSNVPLSLPWLGLGLVGLLWLSTFGLQVPRHDELASGFDAGAHRRLVATNWIRTGLWSLRGGLALGMIFGAVTGSPA